MENNENLKNNELSLEELDEVSGGKMSSGRRVKAVSGDTYVRKHPDKDTADYGVLYRGDSVPYLEA